jgi:hypothetical protein
VRRARILSAVCFAALALILAPALAAAGQASPAPAAVPAASLEYAVKATFLYKFAAFVNWPTTSFETPASPVTLCVLGNDPVAALIDQAAAGQLIAERGIAVKHLQSLGSDSGCHVLYVAVDAAPLDTLSAIRGMPVLTVTDTRRGAPPPGSIVSFFVQDNRVRFDIDDAAAAQNGLVISSKLLSLARTVRPRP